MKKFLISILMFSTILPAFSYAPPIAPVINNHDMQMIREQKFRHEEINDYKEVKEEKARFEKRMKSYEKPVINNTENQKTPELIDENGEIRIKYEN